MTTDPIPSPPGPDEAEVVTSVAVQRAIKLIAGVVAPTTLLTALLYYFGFVATDSFYEYFGVDAATLQFASPDYLMRSVGALYVPIAAILFLGLTLVWAYPMISGFLDRHESRADVRWALRAVLVVGVLAIAYSLVAILWPDTLPNSALGTPLLLAFGLSLVCYLRLIRRMRRAAGDPAGPMRMTRRDVAALGLVLALMVVTGFWAANSYAQSYGRGQAIELSQNLARRPAVVLDTREQLFLTSLPGVQVTTLPVASPDQTFHFRYTGLRLLAQSGRPDVLRAECVGLQHDRDVDARTQRFDPHPVPRRVRAVRNLGRRVGEPGSTWCCRAEGKNLPQMRACRRYEQGWTTMTMLDAPEKRTTQIAQDSADTISSAVASAVGTVQDAGSLATEKVAKTASALGETLSEAVETIQKRSRTANETARKTAKSHSQHAKKQTKKQTKQAKKQASAHVSKARGTATGALADFTDEASRRASNVVAAAQGADVKKGRKKWVFLLGVLLIAAAGGAKVASDKAKAQKAQAQKRHGVAPHAASAPAAPVSPTAVN